MIRCKQLQANRVACILSFGPITKLLCIINKNYTSSIHCCLILIKTIHHSSSIHCCLNKPTDHQPSSYLKLINCSSSIHCCLNKPTDHQPSSYPKLINCSSSIHCCFKLIKII